MTIYTGRWDQLPPNPRYPDQEPTAYVKTDAGTATEIRDALNSWCEYLATIAFDQARVVKHSTPGLTKTQAQRAGWATIDAAIRLNADDPDQPVGHDPQAYTTEQIVKFCLRELKARQNNGRLKDVKKSIIDRHNWQVVHIAYTRFNIEKTADITPEVLDWIDARSIDIQRDAPVPLTASQRRLGSIFEGL